MDSGSDRRFKVFQKIRLTGDIWGNMRACGISFLWYNIDTTDSIVGIATPLIKIYNRTLAYVLSLSYLAARKIPRMGHIPYSKEKSWHLQAD